MINHILLILNEAKFGNFSYKRTMLILPCPIFDRWEPLWKLIFLTKRKCKCSWGTIVSIVWPCKSQYDSLRSLCPYWVLNLSSYTNNYDSTQDNLSFVALRMQTQALPLTHPCALPAELHHDTGPNIVFFIYDMKIVYCMSNVELWILYTNSTTAMLKSNVREVWKKSSA